MKTTYEELLDSFIDNALREDVAGGDHSSLACIPDTASGKAKLLVKDTGLIAGVQVARAVFHKVSDKITVKVYLPDGSRVNPGDIVFDVTGNTRAILQTERLVLNIMQRMSGIATKTQKYVDQLQGLKTKILDTRKTTPGMRFLEKEAVRIGGGYNHRMGLSDMIMLKDNHIDFAGGISKAIEQTRLYLQRKNLDLKVEIEARNFNEIEEILSTVGVDRIMLDNFSIRDTRLAVNMINGRIETESSGGITLDNIRAYAECGVDYISAGDLTHHISSLDLSLKAVKYFILPSPVSSPPAS
jgi:nicotinate-nucleotide pyrophosphorylase (carboxylating)